MYVLICMYPTDWLTIRKNHVVVITEDLHVLSAPIQVGPREHGVISDISMCLERLVSRSPDLVCAHLYVPGRGPQLSIRLNFLSKSRLSIIMLKLNHSILLCHVQDAGWRASVSDLEHLTRRLERQTSGNVYQNLTTSSSKRLLPLTSIQDACAHTLVGHKRSVLALALHPEKDLLFSASQVSMRAHTWWMFVPGTRALPLSSPNVQYMTGDKNRLND